MQGGWQPGLRGTRCTVGTLPESRSIWEERVCLESTELTAPQHGAKICKEREDLEKALPLSGRRGLGGWVALPKRREKPGKVGWRLSFGWQHLFFFPVEHCHGSLQWRGAAGGRLSPGTGKWMEAQD